MKTKHRSHQILFVCYANMCRSPMAEAILKDIIVKDRKLKKLNIVVDSAAMANQYGGARATMSAVKEMKKRCLDITGHVGKPIDSLNLCEYDLILTMESNQRDDILAEYSKLNGRVFTLANYAGSSEDVEDPISTGKYTKCADQLEKYLITIADRLADCNIKTASRDDIAGSRDLDTSALPPRWVEGIVSRWMEHIEISFHEKDDLTTLMPVARIAPSNGKTTIVQFILDKGLPILETERILKDVKRDLDYFLSEKEEPDPWRYAVYYSANTIANIRSTVSWRYLPGPSVKLISN